MAKITMRVSTEDAVNIILGVCSLIHDKTISDSDTYYGDGGLPVLQDALLIAAKAIDTNTCGGSLTKEVLFIEGSAE